MYLLSRTFAHLVDYVPLEESTPVRVYNVFNQ